MQPFLLEKRITAFARTYICFPCPLASSALLVLPLSPSEAAADLPKVALLARVETHSTVFARVVDDNAAAANPCRVRGDRQAKEGLSSTVREDSLGGCAHRRAPAIRQEPHSGALPFTTGT